MSQDAYAIQVNNLNVNYGNSPALWDVNFALKSGELIGIIGPNGAGKSTLLKSVLNFITPLSGEITFFGMYTLDEMRKRISYIPQVQSVDWDFPITAIEVVTMGGYHQSSFFKWSTKALRTKAQNLLDTLGMKQLAHRPISQLSGGQKQKLFIARSLMQDADLFFFDEPFAGIDHVTQQQLVALFRTMKDEGKTVIIVHHDLATVESIFDTVVILNTYLVASGPTSTVFNRDNLSKAYGQSEAILGELLAASKEKSTGLA